MRGSRRERKGAEGDADRAVRECESAGHDEAAVRAERKYERLRDLLARHGVELPAITPGWYERDDDIPF